MGMIDDLMGQGGIASMVKKNPQLLAAAASLLSSKKGSVGGTGGLGGLVGAFEKNGLGDVMGSWISTGANKPISPSQVQAVLGSDTVKEFGARANLGSAEASSALSSLLPALINQFTPKGKVPQSASLETALGSLIGSLGH